MSQSGTPRRNASQWKELIEQQRKSELSASQFCKEHAVGYASFCQWRKRLSNGPKPSPKTEPAFIDLSSLGESSRRGSGWHIVLSLGQGVELTLSQS